MKRINRGMPTPNLDSDQTKRRVAIFLLMTVTYLSLFMVLGWLRGPLLATFSTHWGRALSLPETAYLVVSACLPLVWKSGCFWEKMTLVS